MAHAVIEWKQRQQRKQQFVSDVIKWVEQQPPKWRIFKWLKWQKQCPKAANYGI